MVPRDPRNVQNSLPNSIHRPCVEIVMRWDQISIVALISIVPVNPTKLESLGPTAIGFIVILPYKIYGSGVSHRYNAKIVVSRIVIARVYCILNSQKALAPVFSVAPAHIGETRSGCFLFTTDFKSILNCLSRGGAKLRSEVVSKIGSQTSLTWIRAGFDHMFRRTRLRKM
jgi:hypothetical protein